jgi:hypothetical protein
MSNKTCRSWKFTLNTDFKKEINKLEKIDKTYLKYTIYDDNIVGYIILKSSNRMSWLLGISNHISWTASSFKEVMDHTTNNISTVIENTRNKKGKSSKNDIKESFKESLKNEFKEELRNEIKEELRNEIKEELKSELKEELKDEIKEGSNIITNNIVNNVNVNNNFTIHINNYDDPCAEHLENIDYINGIRKHDDCVPYLIEKIYFNPKIRENHNVYIPDINRGYAVVYNKDSWEIKPKGDVVKRLVEVCDGKMQDWIEEVSGYTKVEDGVKAYERIRDRKELRDLNNRIKEHDSSRENQKIMKKISNNIEFMLFNNKNLPLNNKKLLEDKQ